MMGLDAPKAATVSDTPDPRFDHKSFIKTLTQRPGVYQMYNGAGKVLYVGKAKNLQRRVASYFRARGLNNKTLALVSKISQIEVTVTASETEALLLEQSLIKSLRPPYNVLFRDDKSYPYIYLSNDDYPRITFHRGAKKGKGRYFGPYPNSSAVRESLNFLQKVFKMRQCENSFFRNRSRPCLQYQIKRCSAPCVNYVSKEAYADAVRHTELFLEGKSKLLASELADQMEQASAQLEFERAAELRDQVADLQRVQEQQGIEGADGDIDIGAVAIASGLACIQMIYVRGGRVLGSKGYFPKLQLLDSPGEVLGAFLAQFYLAGSGHEIPRQIIVSHTLPDEKIMVEALSEKAGRRVTVSDRVRTGRAKWLALASRTAAQNLSGHLANRQTQYQRMLALQDGIGLEELPQRLECFDISHISGELTVASCVVFDTSGPLKSDYRRFNIEGVKPGDDYAAMAQALKRRYTRVQKEEGKLPDIVFIDGGKGQLSQAEKIMEELQINNVQLVGVAKGSTRKAGFETLFRGGDRKEIVLPVDSPALHLIQHIRDESHRFAITGHKQRRGKKSSESPLEGIAGVGPKRRRELLRHFGGIQGIQRASVEELVRVPTISKKVAADIYAALHND
jgi:excinuclease ABC subunit C